MINLIYTILPIITLIVGFYFGFRIGKDKEIPKPEIKTPVEIIEECKEKKRQKEEKKQSLKEREDLNLYLANLNNYPNNQIKISEE